MVRMDKLCIEVTRFRDDLLEAKIERLSFSAVKFTQGKIPLQLVVYLTVNNLDSERVPFAIDRTS